MEPQNLVKRVEGVELSKFDRGDISFMILAGALAFFMVPGLAFLYGGLSRRKSALHVAWAVLGSNSVVLVHWFLIGHSLAFSSTSGNGYVGNMAHMALKNVMGSPSATTPLLPDLLLSFFQAEIACVTVGIWIGAVAERGRLLPAMVFTFLWMTVVYCPLVYWIWNPSGWAFKYGVLDFAGGGPVEIGAGFTGLAYSWALGRRKKKELVNFRMSSVNLVYLGQFVLWFGWIAFNAASAFGANLRAVVAVWNTMLAGAFGSLAWCAIDYRHERKYSMVGLCFGSLAGLIAATPSSGFLPPWSSALLGILAATCCNFATKLKDLVGIDDAMDIFALHGVGGMLGLIFTALCADSKITALDGITETKGGFINRNWQQMRIQAVYVLTAALYTFAVSAIFLKIMNAIPALRLRCTEEEESTGMDAVDVGEYAHDFAEIRRDYQDWAQSAYLMESKESTNSRTFSIVSSYSGDRDRVEDIKFEKSVNHTPAVDDVKHTIETEEYVSEKEIPYFEIPRPPKSAHARLAKSLRANSLRQNSTTQAREGKSPNAPPEYFKQPSL